MSIVNFLYREETAPVGNELRNSAFLVAHCGFFLVNLLNVIFLIAFGRLGQNFLSRLCCLACFAQVLSCISSIYRYNINKEYSVYGIVGVLLLVVAYTISNIAYLYVCFHRNYRQYLRSGVAIIIAIGVATTVVTIRYWDETHFTYSRWYVGACAFFHIVSNVRCLQAHKKGEIKIEASIVGSTSKVFGVCIFLECAYVVGNLLNHPIVFGYVSTGVTFTICAIVMVHVDRSDFMNGLDKKGEKEKSMMPRAGEGGGVSKNNAPIASQAAGAIHFSQPGYAHLSQADTTLRTTISVERWRCMAFIFFWTMVILAKILTKIFVVPRLLTGPDPSLPIQQQACGPFNRNNETGFGVGLGQGFDYYTQSHLIEYFGFGNICTSWDYTPSRELTAMYFPFFEYSLVIYLVLDILNIMFSYRRGELPKWYWTFCKAVFVLNVVLCVWFRMIFVAIAYENPSWHTAGFLGLQVVLILVAFQNTFYILLTGQSYPALKLTTVRTARVAWVYLISNFCISVVKIWATMYIVLHGVGPQFYKNDSFIQGLVNGEVVDHIWMFFNALVPFVIAIVRAKYEDPLEITVNCPNPTYVCGGKGEMIEDTALVSNSV